jgi:hypothetical protein
MDVVYMIISKLEQDYLNNVIEVARGLGFTISNYDDTGIIFILPCTKMRIDYRVFGRDDARVNCEINMKVILKSPDEVRQFYSDAIALNTIFGRLLKSDSKCE